MITPADAASTAAAKAAQNAGSRTATKTNSFGIASVDDYWTPERMAKATPLDPPSAPVSAKSFGALALPHLSDSLQRVAGTVGSKPPNVYTMTGAVFFVDDQGELRRCSGTTINSPSRRLVLTAGHCVHGGKGSDFYDVNHWTFIPGPGQNPEPRVAAAWPGNGAQWHAQQLWTKDGWKDSGDRTYDIGIAIMQDRGGQRIVDAIGGQGIEWNRGYGLTASLFGYPVEGSYAGKAFDGKVLWRCGTSATTNQGGFPTMPCILTAGASGGPWLESYSKDRSGDLYFVNGVNSWMFWNGDPTAVYQWQSPYFSDDTIGSLFSQVKSM